jgi:nicotinamidase-related amidase
MRIDFNTKIYDSFEELLDPSHTAVIVVDMQNDLVSREGFLDKVGEDVSANRRIIEPIRTVINGARQAGMLIVYIQYTMDTGHALATPAWVHQGSVLEYMGERKRSYRVEMEACFEGTWGWEVIPELAPEPGDVCVRKNNMGGFWGTNLDKVLRGNGIDTVVITGTATHGCVLDTAVGAAGNDYYTIYARDCVATNDPKGHELGMAFLEQRYLGPSAEELVTCWASAAKPVAA